MNSPTYKKLFCYWLLIISCLSCMPKAMEKSDVVRGVWVASPKHNTFLQTPQSLKEGLDKLTKFGITDIFLCVYADGKTAYPSQVLANNSVYETAAETSFFQKDSMGQDPVKRLMLEAKKRSIRVHFWFEFGFMAQVGAENLSQNPIIEKHPSWLGINHLDEPAHYNDDYYLNSFDPSIQQFFLDLIDEAIQKYPSVAGVQVDDRMPASPIDAGYDSLTRAMYLTETGNEVPADFTNPAWLDWRLNKLNAFGQNLYEKVKSIDTSLIVSSSPNPYPWCKDNLLQDWPTWLEQGSVDWLLVQCYRNDIDIFKNTLNEVNQVFNANSRQARLIPGLLLGVSDRRILSDTLIKEQLRYMESQGIKDVSFFYVKWLAESTDFNTIFVD